MAGLDRRITLEIQAEGTVNQFGENVPGATTTYGIWARQQSAGQADVNTGYGILPAGARTYLVRWFRELALTRSSLIQIKDEDGVQWVCDDISESDARRRYVSLQMVKLLY